MALSHRPSAPTINPMVLPNGDLDPRPLDHQLQLLNEIDHSPYPRSSHPRYRRAAGGLAIIANVLESNPNIRLLLQNHHVSTKTVRGEEANSFIDSLLDQAMKPDEPGLNKDDNGTKATLSKGATGAGPAKPGLYVESSTAEPEEEPRAPTGEEPINGVKTSLAEASTAKPGLYNEEASTAKPGLYNEEASTAKPKEGSINAEEEPNGEETGEETDEQAADEHNNGGNATLTEASTANPKEGCINVVDLDEGVPSSASVVKIPMRELLKNLQARLASIVSDLEMIRENFGM